MKVIEIFPSPLKGRVIAPPSKSLCHRAVIAAALAKGQSTVNNVALSEDIKATIEGIQALGAEIMFMQNKLFIKGGQFKLNENIIIDCKESGSTLRFLIPLGLMSNNSITYTGKGNLNNRPLEPYLEIFKEKGVFHSSIMLPMTIRGKLNPGVFKLKGNISSQFITGLLFALPLLEDDSSIVILDALESKGYIDLTLDVLKDFGINISNNNYQSFSIKGRQRYKPIEYNIEGDYSQGAFWLAAGALGGEVVCSNLSKSTKQGDKAIIDILKLAGAKLEQENDSIKASGSNLQAFEADVSQYPDLAPILAVVAALSSGTSSISGASRLRIKECDRLLAITTELNKLGANICEVNDTLIIKGVEYLHGGEVDSWGDHRIAMALTIAAARCRNPLILHNSNVVDKSYTSFFEDFIILGGSLYERNLG